MKVVAGLLLAFAGSAAFADSHTNVPNGPSNSLPFAYFGNSANPSGDSPAVGEVFSLATGATLSSFSFYAIGDTSASFQLNVARWNPGTNAQNQAVNGVGPSLLTTTGSAVETYDPIAGVTALAFDDLGLSLSANTRYIAYLTSSDSSVTGIQLSRTQTAQDGSGFGLGFAYLSTNPDVGWQLPFNGNGFLSLQYTASTAIAAPVPEPGTYALMLAGLGVIGFVLKRRNHPQA